ncbi:hypothetical protein GFC29_3863 (plasmid) [Anoxybacillus sp. B7M1]|uniref:hypothetical protein n=1 Tax=Anoxybacillus sp. B7M1 TaxID=1490057 RepID=UPI0007B5E8E2|nr:hypothetical protein [Anoxybacillus sp. B7M1]ANB66144.1 hypothetical protein GFC29_3863 [Anoxybacillus sp. B7M1]
MTKKEIMKKAVALAKKMIGDWIARMALALKMVWAEVKEKMKKAFPALKGTAKQVAWANDIREKAVAALSEMVKEYAAKLDSGEYWSDKDHAYRSEKKTHLFEAFDALLNVEESKVWIELFGVNHAVSRQGVDRWTLVNSFAQDWLRAKFNRRRLADSFSKRMGVY